MRPFVVQTQDDSEEVGQYSPDTSRTPRSTARRSLAAIQLEVAGGKACAARRSSRRRYPSHRRTCVVVCYNPQVPGECMFSAIARALKLTYGRTLTVRALRRLTYDLLQRAESGPVQRCAAQYQQDPQEFIENVKRGRWGTSLDFRLLAEELQLPCVLLNRETGSLLFEHQCIVPKKQILVLYENFHFTVGRQPRSHVRNELPLVGLSDLIPSPSNSRRRSRTYLNLLMQMRLPLYWPGTPQHQHRHL
eukprot:6490109-Amphidinium_carterae.2